MLRVIIPEMREKMGIKEVPLVHMIHSLHPANGAYSFCDKHIDLWTIDWNKVTCKDCLVAKEEKDGRYTRIS